MKVPFFVTIIFIVLFSCKRIIAEKQASMKPNTSEASTKDLSMYCFYEMDDKYFIQNDYEVIVEWLEGKSIAIKSDKELKNIFDHRGGGPNGAEWNPSTSLYIAVMTPSKIVHESLALYINNIPYSQSPFFKKNNIYWYKIPKDFWEKELRTIDHKTIDQMYKKDYLKAIKKGEVHPAVDLSYGNVIKFEIRLKERIVTNFFHAAFGE